MVIFILLVWFFSVGDCVGFFLLVCRVGFALCYGTERTEEA